MIDARRHPLDDPAYKPKHPPLPGGGVPDVVAKWGVRSQRRWFRRFLPQLGCHTEDVWNRFYVHSEYHRGLCCSSCLDEMDEGYGDYPYKGYCCCRAGTETISR